MIARRGSTRRCQATALMVVVMAGVSTLVGCSSIPIPWRKVALDAATGFYNEASLVYRVDAGKLQQPLDVMRVEGQKVSYEQVASSTLPEQSIGTLAVIQPHPAGRAGFAQVKFTLESAPTKSKPAATSWNPLQKKEEKNPVPKALVGAQPEVYESWLLDIPAGEADQLFKLLSSHGFYQTQKPEPAVQLTVKINGQQVKKNWGQIAELNAMVQRVRREGRLAAYVCPGGATGKAYRPIASTRAYSELLAQTGIAVPQDSVFSMAVPAGTSPPGAVPPIFGPPAPEPQGAGNVANLPTVNR